MKKLAPKTIISKKSGIVYVLNKGSYSYINKADPDPDNELFICGACEESRDPLFLKKKVCQKCIVGYGRKHNFRLDQDRFQEVRRNKYKI